MAGANRGFCDSRKPPLRQPACSPGGRRSFFGSGEQTTGLGGRDGLGPNRIGNVNSGDQGVIRPKDEEVTENSSSFDGTFSEDGNTSASAGVEAESRVRDFDDITSEIDGFGNLFRTRNKKLTNAWQNFRRPLMWRCKWMELQILELEFQASLYDREIAKYDERGKQKTEKFATNEYGMKSVPSSSKSLPMKIMKRRKRKRVEDVIDKASYMSQHNLFSYYEKRRSIAEGPFIEDVSNRDKFFSGCDEIGTNIRSTPEIGNTDYSKEQLLWIVEVVLSQGRKLKTRIDKVVSETYGKFSFTDTLALTKGSFTPSNQNQVSPETGESMRVRFVHNSTQHICGHNTIDLARKSEVPNHGDFTPLADEIERSDQFHINVSSEYAEDEFLLHNLMEREL